MARSWLRMSRIITAVIIVAGTSSLHAQLHSPLDALKNAYKKAKQPSPESPQPASTAAPPQSRTGAQAPSPPVTSDTVGCCSPDAIKALASSMPNIDIVGITLGMSREQVVAALRASQPNLKIDIVNSRLQRPGVATFDRVPQWMYAHTSTPGAPGSFQQADGSYEGIEIQFATPPSAPVVVRVTRTVGFPQTAPVAAANLLTALHQKYGDETFSDGQKRVWVFDIGGKPLARRLNDAERVCYPVAPDTIAGADFTRDASNPIDLGTTMMDDSHVLSEMRALCRPFVFVVTDFGEGTTSASRMDRMTVRLQSPALLRNARQATHDWLQQQADAIQQRQTDDARKRAAPKL